MIKILFFIDTMQSGGAAKVLLDLVNAIDQSKFEITVQTIFQENVDVKLAPGICYKYCYKTNDKLHRAILRIESEFGCIYKNRFVGEYDIECAYLESLSTKIIATSTNKTSIKCAWIHCDIERMASDLQKYVAKTKTWYKKFDRIICVSKTIKEAVDRQYGYEFKTSVIYNSIDDEDIRRKAQLQLFENVRTETPKLVTVGTLYPPKNHLRLLKAVKRLKEETDIYLWILGGGPDQNKLERYVKENGLQQQVQMMGYCSNPYPYINDADLVVCSSNYEGFSTFITEGLILGKPIVTTECSGMRELLGDSEYGLITANDDEAFYQGLKRMLTEPGLLAHYREKAAVRGADFQREKLVRETEKFLTDAWLEKQGR